jgi:CBS domain-containing protein
MLVTTVAYLLARRHGLNHEQLSSPIESPAHAGREVLGVLETTKVSQVQEQLGADVLTVGLSLGRAREAVARGGVRLVVDDAGRLAGALSPDVLAPGGPPDETPLREVMSLPPPTVRPGDDLAEALEHLHDLPLDALPVVQGERGPLVGVVRRAAIIEVLRRWADEGRDRLLREHTGVRALEHEGRLGAMLSRLPETRRHAARRWPVPAEVVGRSLREARVRNTYGVDVIAVQTAAGEFLAPPAPDRPLEEGDVLVVLGTAPPPDDAPPAPPPPPAGAA